MRDAAAAASGLGVCGAARGNPIPTPALHEALYYEPHGGGRVQCTLCPWGCIVSDGKRGRCGVRENRGGRYFSLVYGRPVSIHNDPIEKKPLFHIYPGSKALSLATAGCNIECKFCQNWEISQARPEHFQVRIRTPDSLAEQAAHAGSRTLAYTYSEPTIFFEYMMDCARAARGRGIGNVMISNGFISEAPLKDLCSVMTAIKIDLKAFSQQFYGEVCSGRLQPVLDTLLRLRDSGVWYEIVVLLIPTLNDASDELKRMTEWIVTNLGPNVPVHFTRYHPQYKMKNIPPTPIKIVNRAREIGLGQGCRFVYGGNMPGQKGENTVCPDCGALLINRYGFTIMSDNLKDGTCGQCGAVIPGVWI